MSAGGMKSPFGAYDIRGVYGENLTEEFAGNLGFAAYKHIAIAGGKFVIGHDVRSSSPLLAKALAESIAAAGGKVTMLGVASTPRLYWHGAEHKFDCSIAVTASHLPAKHNGFKICRQNAVPISSEDGLVEIEQILMQSTEASRVHDNARGGAFGTGGPDAALATSQTGSDKSAAGNIVQDSRGFDEYINALKHFFNLTNPIKIVVDCGGSPVGREAARLFEDSKVTIVPLGFDEDANFSRRSPNPIDEGALTELSDTVVREKAAFGAAFDGDGDRVVFVDEWGTMIDPDLVTALLAERVLAANPGSNIMYDLRSSRAVKERITACGGVPLKSRVGHSFIKADMRKQNVALAGELSAHYYWSDLFYTDNALRALIEMANLLSHRSDALSALIKPLQQHAGTGEINFKTKEAKAIIDALRSNYSTGTLDFTDGLTVEYEDWWFNVRTSHTEPVVRLCVGAVDAERLVRRRAELENLIEKAIKTPAVH